nr:bifunctional DNA primase/polymerase [Kribbella italica]
MSAALDAARRDWPVFPLCPGSKVPAMSDWETNATTDTDRIERYWSHPGHRGHGVAIACGPAGLVVIDLDKPKPGQTPPPAWARPGITDGCDVLADLCDAAGQPFPSGTFTVQTGRGGFHLYFTSPGGLRCTEGGWSTGLGWLIDTRSGGGYVVAAGSVVGGNHYGLVHDTQPGPLPPWLATRLTPTAPTPARSGPVQLRSLDHAGRAAAYVRRAIDTECAHVVGAGEGGRNKALFIAAQNLGQLAAGGAVSADDVRAALMDAAATPIGHGAYSETQAHKTITSGLRAGANRPRKVAA